jgi:hypothetical protein
MPKPKKKPAKKKRPERKDQSQIALSVVERAISEEEKVEEKVTSTFLRKKR